MWQINASALGADHVSSTTTPLFSLYSHLNRHLPNLHIKSPHQFHITTQGPNMCQKSRLDIPSPYSTSLLPSHLPIQTQISPLYPLSPTLLSTRIRYPSPTFSLVPLPHTLWPLSPLPRSLILLASPHHLSIPLLDLHCCLDSLIYTPRQIKFTLPHPQLGYIKSVAQLSGLACTLQYTSLSYSRVQIARQIYSRPSRNIVSPS